MLMCAGGLTATLARSHEGSICGEIKTEATAAQTYLRVCVGTSSAAVTVMLLGCSGICPARYTRPRYRLACNTQRED